jgi:hypothetical protein
MCHKCEEKKCKRSCGHRKREKHCEEPVPEPEQCKPVPKCAAAQACGLKQLTKPTGVSPPPDTVGVNADYVIGFASLSNWNSSASSIKLTNGIFQIDEPGVYCVSYSVRVHQLVSDIEYKAALYTYNSHTGMCNVSCGCCHFGIAPENTSGNSGWSLVICSESTTDGPTGQILQHTVLVNVLYPCTQLALVNKSKPTSGTDDVTIDLDTNPASLSIAKIASCGC